MYHFIVPLIYYDTLVQLIFLPLAELLHEQERKERKDDHRQMLRHVEKSRFEYRNEWDNTLKF